MTPPTRTNLAPEPGASPELNRRLWDLRGSWQVREAPDGGDIPEFSCTATGSPQRLLAREGHDFALATGDVLRVSACVRAEGGFDGTLRLGVWVVDAAGECVLRRALRLTVGAGLETDAWVPVEGELRINKPGAVRGRAWLLAEADATQGSARIRDFVLSRAMPRPAPIPKPAPEPEPAAAAAAAEKAVAPRCGICGAHLEGLDPSHETCPSCGSRARTRSIAALLREHVLPMLPPDPAWPGSRAELPLLGFAVTPTERRVLEPHFTAVKSASLYLEYGDDHEVGIDARDLPYANDSYCAVMACCVFDYFTEQEQAFSECWRVLQPGGVMFVQYMSGRLLGAAEPPFVHNYIPQERRTYGFMKEVPADTQIPSIRVGRQWLLDAMTRCGFESRRVGVEDEATGLVCDWFIGRKPGGPFRRVHYAADPAQRALRGAEFEFALRDGFDHRRLRLLIGVPEVPPEVRSARFAEHVRGAGGDCSDEVVLARSGGVVVSRDLGQTWFVPPTPEVGSAQISNVFTTASGVRLLQARGRADLREPVPDGADPGTIFRYDRDWHYLGTSRVTDAHWHGSRSIDQSGTTIMFGDYHGNRAKYEPEFADDPERSRPYLRANRIWRSRDDGQTWDAVLEAPAFDVRHLHTVAADPWSPGVWWASSGDSFTESRVWRSDDDGDRWTQVTDLRRPEGGPPSFALEPRSRYRFTDLVVGPDFLLWGTDDMMGTTTELDPALAPEQRAGARLYRASKQDLADVEELANVGNLVRSVIDIGPAWLFVSQAKDAHGMLLRPSLVLVSKQNPRCVQHLIDLPNRRSTCFTCSIASRNARDGVFFTHRNAGDLFDARPSLLRWQASFD